MKNHFSFLFLFLAIPVIFGIFFSCKNTTTESTVSTSVSTSPPTTEKKAINELNRFEPEILRFDSLDKADGLTQNGILFTGSSSIRFWLTLKEDMAPMTVVNRGFGGSTIPEVLHYCGRYLFQHHPQIVVLYCGENDIAAGATPEDVFASFKTFVKIMETRMPKTKLVFISMKPSIARWNLWDQYQKGNQLIQEFMSGKPNMLYVEAAETMLAVDGKVKQDIFIADGLHMNAKGYNGWKKQLKPILEKMYQKE